ncbi:hypothetical protein ACHAPT_005407 [Fusarium lateritium]
MPFVKFDSTEGQTYEWIAMHPGDKFRTILEVKHEISEAEQNQIDDHDDDTHSDPNAPADEPVHAEVAAGSVIDPVVIDPDVVDSEAETDIESGRFIQLLSPEADEGSFNNELDHHELGTIASDEANIESLPETVSLLRQEFYDVTQAHHQHLCQHLHHRARNMTALTNEVQVQGYEIDCLKTAIHNGDANNTASYYTFQCQIHDRFVRLEENVNNQLARLEQTISDRFARLEHSIEVRFTVRECINVDYEPFSKRQRIN